MLNFVSIPRIAISLALVTAALLCPTACLADAKADVLANKRGKTEVPKILVDNQYSCDLVDAFYTGKAQVEVEGKRTAIEIYEVACKGRRGALLRVSAAGKIESATDCYEAEAERKVQKNAPICILPLNKNNSQWLEVLVKPLSPKCDIHAIVYIGKTPDKTATVYEVACKGGSSGGSGFYTVSTTSGTETVASYVSCLRSAATSLKCTRTDEKGAITNYKPLAEMAVKGCTPANARFMGGTKEALYYELLCADETNFVLVTGLFDQFKKGLSCIDAEKLGAKCQFDGKPAAKLASVDAVSTSVAKGDLGAYTAAAARLGKTCTVREVKVLGRDAGSKRELAELKCQETPYGLAGYILTSEGPEKGDLTDCFIATVRRFDCKFFPLAAQKARISELAGESSSIKADCVVSEIRYIGATAEEDLTVEIACENKRGYIAVISPARDKIEKALPCRIAANRPDWEKCTIEGNGTFAG